MKLSKLVTEIDKDKGEEGGDRTGGGYGHVEKDVNGNASSTIGNGMGRSNSSGNLVVPSHSHFQSHSSSSPSQTQATFGRNSLDGVGASGSGLGLGGMGSPSSGLGITTPSTSTNPTMTGAGSTGTGSGSGTIGGGSQGQRGNESTTTGEGATGDGHEQTHQVNGIDNGYSYNYGYGYSGYGYGYGSSSLMGMGGGSGMKGGTGEGGFLTEKYFGMENFGNTCYANSVLQALYFCQPFREEVETFGLPKPPLVASTTSSSTPLLSHIQQPIDPYRSPVIPTHHQHGTAPAPSNLSTPLPLSNHHAPIPPSTSTSSLSSSGFFRRPSTSGTDKDRGAISDTTSHSLATASTTSYHQKHPSSSSSKSRPASSAGKNRSHAWGLSGHKRSGSIGHGSRTAAADRDALPPPSFPSHLVNHAAIVGPGGGETTAAEDQHQLRAGPSSSTTTTPTPAAGSLVGGGSSTANSNDGHQSSGGHSTHLTTPSAGGATTSTNGATTAAAIASTSAGTMTSDATAAALNKLMAGGSADSGQNENENEPTLLGTMKDLFKEISGQAKTTGTVAPKDFITQLRKENELFRSTMHQDAHEFLNYLLNTVAETVETEQKERGVVQDPWSTPTPTNATAALPRVMPGGRPLSAASQAPPPPKTWVHHLFEGTLTNEMRCLTCETVTSRDESFLDLSIDIEQNSSVTNCLRQFSKSEMLCQKNKFDCDRCCGLQEAEKRMKIKKLPNILALHLKRFKYQEDLQRYIKLTYRVPFPSELRLFNTADNIQNADRLYHLWAIVVHIGVGPHHGHYVCLIKSGSKWHLFDDNVVTTLDESEIQKYFGDTPGQGSGYVLFYAAADVIRPPHVRIPAARQASAARAPSPSASPTKSTFGLKSKDKVKDKSSKEKRPRTAPDKVPPSPLSPGTTPVPPLPNSPSMPIGGKQEASTSSDKLEGTSKMKRSLFSESPKKSAVDSPKLVDPPISGSSVAPPPIPSKSAQREKDKGKEKEKDKESGWASTSLRMRRSFRAPKRKDRLSSMNEKRPDLRALVPDDDLLGSPKPSSPISASPSPALRQDDMPTVTISNPRGSSVDREDLRLGLSRANEESVHTTPSPFTQPSPPHVNGHSSVSAASSVPSTPPFPPIGDLGDPSPPKSSVSPHLEHLGEHRTASRSMPNPGRLLDNSDTASTGASSTTTSHSRSPGPPLITSPKGKQRRGSTTSLTGGSSSLSVRGSSIFRRKDKDRDSVDSAKLRSLRVTSSTLSKIESARTATPTSPAHSPSLLPRPPSLTGGGPSPVTPVAPSDTHTEEFSDIPPSSTSMASLGSLSVGGHPYRNYDTLTRKEVKEKEKREKEYQKVKERREKELRYQAAEEKRTKEMMEIRELAKRSQGRGAEEKRQRDDEKTRKEEKKAIKEKEKERKGSGFKRKLSLGGKVLG